LPASMTMLMTVTVPASRLTTTRRLSSGVSAIADPRSCPVATVVQAAGPELELELLELLEPASPLPLDVEPPASSLVDDDVTELLCTLLELLLTELVLLVLLLLVLDDVVCELDVLLASSPASGADVLLPHPVATTASDAAATPARIEVRI